MRQPKVLLLILLLALWIVPACSGSDSDDDDDVTPTDGDTSDDDDDDDDQPTDDDDDVDGDDEDGDVEPECVFPSDCTRFQDCVNGECVAAPSCTEPLDCPDYATQLCWFENDDAVSGVCRHFCTTDADCGEHMCYMGLCHPYETPLQGTVPNSGATEEQALKASYVERQMLFPFGTEMGGYGTRVGPDGPYAEAMGSATGASERLMISALTLDDGVDRVVFVSFPSCFITDSLEVGIVERVIELGGPDLSGRLIINAAHTHSGPGRFWEVLADQGFGALGIGAYSNEVWNALTDSIGETIYEGQLDEAFVPAAFGYAINDDFDPENKINRDRRSENDPYKDPRLIVWRVDDVSTGNKVPMLAVVNFAAHGTITDVGDTFYSADTGGGAAIMTAKYLTEQYGVPVRGMFLQGMAGDISPAGGDLKHDLQTQMQMVGIRVARKAHELFNNIETSTDLNIKTVSKYYPINRDYIGYTDDEFFSLGSGNGMEICDPGPIRFGAFQCGTFATVTEGNINIEILDENGNVVDEAHSSSANDKVRLDSPEYTGTYYVRVWGPGTMNLDYSLEIQGSTTRKGNCYDGATGAPCNLFNPPKPMLGEMADVSCEDDQYEDDDSTDTARSLSIGDTVEHGVICPNDDDYFSVELTQGEKTTFILSYETNNQYNPYSRLEDGMLGCALVMEKLIGAPVPDFGKTHLMAVGLGDLMITTLPGEPTSRMGKAIIEAIQPEVSNYNNVMVLGYTNDHHFYLVLEDDWFQGGYNTTMSIWGFKFGDYLVYNLVDLAKVLDTDDESILDDIPAAKPTNVDHLFPNNLRVPPKDAKPTEASITKQGPGTIQRMQQQYTVTWEGGDPGVDWPLAFLEKQEGDNWTAVKDVFGDDYSDRYYNFYLDFYNQAFSEPNNSSAENKNLWSYTWEETYTFPAGTYRLRIEGRYYDSDAAEYDASAVKPYTITTDPFEIVGSDIIPQQIAQDGNNLTGQLRYGQPVSNNDGASPFEAIQTRTMVLHSEECEPYIGPRPLPADLNSFSGIVLDSGETQVGLLGDVQYAESTGNVMYLSARDEAGNETYSTREGLPITTFSAELPAGLVDGETYTLVFTVGDTYGNGSESRLSFTYAAPRR